MRGRLLFPGFILRYIRPLFCEAKGHCRWIALSGAAEDIHAIDDAMLDAFGSNRSVVRWLTLAKTKVPLQGLPARTCMLAYGERARMGRLINELVRSGEVLAPVAISREHLDAGSVASPYRETERMEDGSDPIADWPILNAMLAAVAGAAWVSVQQGGGVGIGRSIHAGFVGVADGSEESGEKLHTLLTNDPASGVLRYADAGYEHARAFAADSGLRIPMPSAAE